MLHKTIVALAVVLWSGPVLAAPDDPCKATSSTADVRFELALKDGRTSFQEGEIVPLVLSFSSAVKDRYWADDRNYDRSGRLSIEVYCVEPLAPDPLEAYFKTGYFIGGGLFGIRKLDTPLIAGAELNEWHRLAPGHYRVYAISRDRVWRTPAAAEQTSYGRVSQVLRSNAVELDVTAPDPIWQSEQIGNAMQTLADARNPEAARHAARILRFLNTQESTRQLAKLLGRRGQQPLEFDLMFGLYGSSFGKLAVDSMHNEIAAPDHAITADFLKTLVNLQVTADSAWDPPQADSANPAVAREFWPRRQAHISALTKAETEKVVAALNVKVGSARAETLNGLLMIDGLDPSIMRTISSALIDAWPDLSAETQRGLIQYRWPLIKSPAMLPILRRLVALPPPRGRSNDAQTRDGALMHIMELDPELGRTLILHDAMGSAEPSLAVVRLLPVGDITAVVKSAVQRIGENRARDLDYELLDRYADSSALSVVERVVEANPGMWWACMTLQAPRYLLRVDPAYGAKLVAALLSSRKVNACYKGLLQGLGDELPKVQDIAIKALDDPDPDMVLDALIALDRWGAPGAEAALWARLKRFHDEWAGREDQLRATPDVKNDGSRGVALEQSLVHAIAHGTGWICPPDKLAVLADLVSTRGEKQRIEGWIKAWRNGRAVINPTWYPEDSPSFTVLQYDALNEKQLATKLAQFPSGTQLLWQFQKPGEIAWPLTMAVQEAAFERLRSIAEKHGVTLGKLNYP